MNLVDGIAPSVQFGSRMHVSKFDLLDFEIPYVREILLMCSDSLVLCFDTYFMYLFFFESTKKTRSEKPYNLVEVLLDLL